MAAKRKTVTNLVVRISSAHRKQLRTQAKKAGRTLSDYVRMSLGLRGGV